MRSLMIRYRERQSWNDTDVSRPAGTPLKMMLGLWRQHENNKMVMSNRRFTIKKLAEEISISHGSCHTILYNNKNKQKNQNKNFIRIQDSRVTLLVELDPWRALIALDFGKILAETSGRRFTELPNVKFCDL